MNDDEKIIKNKSNPDNFFNIVRNKEEEFLEIAYPSYSENSNNNILKNIDSNSLELLIDMKFFRIVSCTIEKLEDVFHYLNEKMEKFFSAIHNIDISVAYGVISYHEKPNIVLGINKKENIVVIRKIIEGLLSGIEIEEFETSFFKEYKSHFGFITAIPTKKIKDEPQKFDLSPLIRSLNGQEYILLFIARPLSSQVISEKIEDLMTIKDECFSISRRIVSKQKTNTKTEGKTENITNSKSKSINFFLSKGSNNSNSQGKNISDSQSKTEGISFENQNSYALQLMNYVEKTIERLVEGLNNGMWQTTITYSANSKLVRSIIQSSLCAEISKPNLDVLPLKFYTVEDNIIKNQPLLVPKKLLSHLDEDIKNPLCSFLNSSELGFLATIPTDSVPNFELRYGKNYPLISSKIKTDKTIEIGKITDGKRVMENMNFALSEEDLNKHTFICGITGSGKTNTVKVILKNCDKPFMVIESAKKEYRNIKLKNSKRPIIYTLGKPEINCLRFNPFYIMCGISPQLHIDFLKDLFNASFSFYGPMSYILEKCLHNIYKNKGWNLTLGFHPYLVNVNDGNNFFDEKYMKEQYNKKAHKFLFPTMQDLKDEIERYINEEMQYDGEASGNIKTAIKVRLESLCTGAKGYMFNTNECIDFDKLLKENIVFELEGLADDSDKAFCVGLLVIYINEFRQVEKELQLYEKQKLKHLLVIEEAHRLLKNIETERVNENIGNPKGKAVEHFTNMIAEMRSYGEGVIIAEQIPSKLAPDVIKNSSNKIIQRIVSLDDQSIIANTIGMQGNESIYIGNLNTGYSLCHKEGMTMPVSVKVNKVEDNFVSDTILYNENNDERIHSINLAILREIINNYIEKCIIQLLDNIMIENNYYIIEAIKMCKKEVKHIMKKKNISLVLCKDENKIISEIISEAIINYITNGVYSVKKIIRNKLYDNINDLILNPTDKKIDLLKSEFSILYEKDVKVVGMYIISQLIKSDLSRNIDLRKSIEKYFFKVENKTIEEIIEIIKAVDSND